MKTKNFLGIILGLFIGSNLLGQTVNYIPKFSGSTGSVINSRIYDNGSRVGIGTAAPKYALDVNGSFGLTGSAHFYFAHEGGHGVINFGNAGNGDLHFRSLPVGGDGSSFYELMTIKNDGRVGIGEGIDPSAKFHVRSGNNNSMARFTSNLAGADLEFAAFANYASIRNLKSGKGMEFSVNGKSDQLYLTPEGNIGIGTKDTKTYKLAIAGNMIAEEIVVKLQTNWPDYVFEENYNLRSLMEVEQYIKEHKHLPNVPSAAEVKENGIELSEMNSILLQKIEELTLHTIQQQKLIEDMSKEINSLKETLK